MSDEIDRLFPQFINDINLIQPEYNLSDRVWQFPMRFGPNLKDWTMVQATLYENTYYCYWTEWDLSLEFAWISSSDPKQRSISIHRFWIQRI